jgi:hypothetical protein
VPPTSPKGTDGNPVPRLHSPPDPAEPPGEDLEDGGPIGPNPNPEEVREPVGSLRLRHELKIAGIATATVEADVRGDGLRFANAVLLFLIGCASLTALAVVMIAKTSLDWAGVGVIAMIGGWGIALTLRRRGGTTTV